MRSGASSRCLTDTRKDTASAPELDVLYAYEGLLSDPDGRTVSLAQLVGTKGA
jgi:hypothetical protein